MEILLFISYETDTGYAYARLAKARFIEARFRPWVWHDDRTTGEYLHEEVANHIDQCAYVVYINSEGSHDSGGQKFERNTAFALNKPPHVISLGGSILSPVLSSCNRIPTDGVGFEMACDRLAKELNRRAELPIPSSESVQAEEPLKESVLVAATKPRTNEGPQ